MGKLRVLSGREVCQILAAHDFVPSGQQPEFLQEPEQLLPVPTFMSALQLTIGDLFGWLKPGNP